VTPHDRHIFITSNYYLALKYNRALNKKKNIMAFHILIQFRRHQLYT